MRWALRTDPGAAARADCRGKRAYATPQAAWTRAVADTRLWGTPMRAYRCPHCGAWHVANATARTLRLAPYQRARWATRDYLEWADAS